MSTTSILYHVFNIKGVEYRSTKFIGDAVIFSVEMTDKFIKCPQCGCLRSIFKGQKSRLFKMGPCGRKQPLPEFRDSLWIEGANENDLV